MSTVSKLFAITALAVLLSAGSTGSSKPASDLQEQAADSTRSQASGGQMVLIEGSMPIDSDANSTAGTPKTQVKSFHLNRSPVTVAQFEQFVAATDYQTTAEEFNESAVLSLKTGRWQLLSGANWRNPLGKRDGQAIASHPVVHVSWYDSVAYCSHYGGRLPTENEWEYAARGGREGRMTIYSFGDQLVQEGEFLANTWTGMFPFFNTARDGYVYTSPVGVFGRTSLGLTDMAGNVWEWSADSFVTASGNHGEHHRQDSSTSTDQQEKIQKGGSFLCAASFCHGYKITAQGHSTPDSSHMHVGFRCAADTS